MSTRYYDLCRRYRGQVVDIRSRDGRKYRGKIVNVDRQYVYLQPDGGRGRRGFGYGFYGGPFFFGPQRIALAAIAGIAIAGLFFW
ncbi:hypothetical protein [Bacillus marinisedimentorum]|uniref:hypothetical protein n=1 Tax=Bacillus marinisedimentorum TaxID=1821260 RepID=UPI000871F6D0|nr:hypothetical protein [Bacillus marinisedimentorum]